MVVDKIHDGSVQPHPQLVLVVSPKFMPSVLGIGQLHEPVPYPGPSVQAVSFSFIQIPGPAPFCPPGIHNQGQLSVQFSQGVLAWILLYIISSIILCIHLQKYIKRHQNVVNDV